MRMLITVDCTPTRLLEKSVKILVDVLPSYLVDVALVSDSVFPFAPMLAFTPLSPSGAASPSPFSGTSYSSCEGQPFQVGNKMALSGMCMSACVC